MNGNDHSCINIQTSLEYTHPGIESSDPSILAALPELFGAGLCFFPQRAKHAAFVSSHGLERAPGRWDQRHPLTDVFLLEGAI